MSTVLLRRNDEYCAIYTRTWRNDLDKIKKLTRTVLAVLYQVHCWRKGLDTQKKKRRGGFYCERAEASLLFVHLSCMARGQMD